jgi:hypothetical protein
MQGGEAGCHAKTGGVTPMQKSFEAEEVFWYYGEGLAQGQDGKPLSKTPGRTSSSMGSGVPFLGYRTTSQALIHHPTSRIGNLTVWGIRKYHMGFFFFSSFLAACSWVFFSSKPPELGGLNQYPP